MGYIPTLEDHDLNSFFDPTEMLQKKFPDQIRAEKELSKRSKTMVVQKKAKPKADRHTGGKTIDLSNGPFYDQIKDLVENEKGHPWE